MDCRHLDDLYELYLLGTLSPQEAGMIGEHLERQCANCRERLREAALTVYFLCLPAGRSRPPAELKAQLMRRVRKKS